MSWALIDDQSTFHGKVLAAGNAAWGGCVRMIAWSCAHLTDGEIPAHVAKLIASDQEIEKMISVGLLEVIENGFAICNFLEWNKSAKQIRKERAARQKAGKSGGLESGKKRKQSPSKREASASALLPTMLNPLPSPPLPSSPIPNNKQTLTSDEPTSGGDPSDDEPAPESETKILDLPLPYSLTPSDPEPAKKRRNPDPVTEIHEHYLDAKQRHNPRTLRTKLLPKGRKAIIAALKAGFSPDVLKRACDGLFRSEHHLTGGYLTIDFAMRESNIERFAGLADLAMPSALDASGGVGCPVPAGELIDAPPSIVARLRAQVNAFDISPAEDFERELDRIVERGAERIKSAMGDDQ